MISDWDKILVLIRNQEAFGKRKKTGKWQLSSKYFDPIKV